MVLLDLFRENTEIMSNYVCSLYVFWTKKSMSQKHSFYSDQYMYEANNYFTHSIF
jgi:hypothetical protein